MPRWPRPLDALDRRLGADPPEDAAGALVCFEPVLPPQAGCPPALWNALRVRADERRREWRGPVGEGVRALAARGVVRVDRHGVLRDPGTGRPLDRANAELRRRASVT
jgi:hypothetical protein